MKNLKRYLQEPIFTPLVDRFVMFGFAVAGAFASIYSSEHMPFLELLHYLLLFLLIAMPILEWIGTNWREKRGIKEESVRSPQYADKIIANLFVILSMILGIVSLGINLLAESFNWRWMVFMLVVVLFSFFMRYILIKR
ncbi:MULTISPECIES: hypothetical protein [Virgibacillus]|uniref:Uncharacterized protein n=2 Tax=Virgibacillus TaxID=84406 RepID=A0A024Q8D1_9BACI|nr:MULTISPECIES: hypothetical protein [Virgibacillus]EQB37716.1 hypothetical protein M948_03935 [Virgibacillus sp. CM-4]MYL40452.1 hypothetical protein [Virgibacillus massiliensis]GGJ58860.1 hypothetical protein GCM10007111_21100 [Virgibacillus kapii]CDQ38759.1 hypothetical protein BN990_01032 [Virgibacillus massiliensis]